MSRPYLLFALAWLISLPCAEAQDLWLTKAHDARRTGQSRNHGPLAIDPLQTWVVEAPGAIVLNVGATVDARGVYFGSWGLLRRNTEGLDTRFWDKSDGKLYGHDLATGAPLWGEALSLDLTPRCYDYPGRGPNLLWCGLTPYEVSFYNGTVEGQASVDTARGVLYLGRGDGKLYAVDPVAGAIRWRFVTFNPLLPDDPDGGGEVVASPLIGPDGLVYFGTWGEGDHETNAFYAVAPDGLLGWRYPAEASLTHRIFASAALSPDGETVFVSTYRDDEGGLPATLYAFHRNPLTAVPDEDRLKWSLDLEWKGLPLQTTTLAVGSDGTVYVGGLMPELFGVPVLTAVEDRGDHGAFRWAPEYVELRDGAQFVLGVALREPAGVTERLFVTTANLGTSLFNAKAEGALYALDPATGAVLAAYDPSDDVPEAVGGLNSPAIDADGAVYFGVRGRFGDNPVNGYYFAVDYDPQTALFTKRWHYEVDGYIEWTHPAIGPDGGIYAGSAVNESPEQTRLATYDDGVIPDDSTPLFYALKGPVMGVAVEPEPGGDAGPVRLTAAYPNPAAGPSWIELDLGRPGAVRVEVVDVLGRTVARLAEGTLPAGRHPLVWDGAAAPGVYLVRAVWTDAATGATARVARPLLRLR